MGGLDARGRLKEGGVYTFFTFLSGKRMWMKWVEYVKVKPFPSKMVKL